MRGWSLLQEHPDWSPAALGKGAAFLQAFLSVPLSQVKCETPSRKWKSSYSFSPLHSLFSIKQSGITPPFFRENGFHFSLPLHSASWPQWSRKEKKIFLISAGCSSLASSIVSLGIFPLATHTAVLNLNHTEVTWNSHTCQFYSHTSSAITSLKTIRPSFTLAKLYKKKKKYR